MGEIIKLNPETEVSENGMAAENEIIQVAEGLLYDTRTLPVKEDSMSVPIDQLLTLGAGVAALSPRFRTITQTFSFETEGLYKLANAVSGDVLKKAKNGNFWGAFHTAEGASKFAQLKPADTLNATSTTIPPLNPATMMMAVALIAIEKKLDAIAQTQKNILAFMEIEKASQVEGDVETLNDLMQKYKYNWDNETFVNNSHMKAFDLQQSARQNIISYKKNVRKTLDTKVKVLTSGNVNARLKELQKLFSYYRLSLYTFSFASLMEILLGGNFKEEYIAGIISDISNKAHEYRKLYDECSNHIEYINKYSIEATVLKGIGDAGSAIGQFVGNVPLVKDADVDKFFKDGGSELKANAKDMVDNAVRVFAKLSNPETVIFTERMHELIRIYNHTEQICFDDKNIYLIAG